MDTQTATKKIQEEDILISLDNAINAYKTKSFEAVTKKSLANSKPVKRSSKSRSKQKIKLFTKKVEPVEVIKIKRKNKRKMGFIKRNRLAVMAFFSSVGQFISKYNRQFLTTGLVMIMLGFVTYSTYIAYAYMSGANDDVVTKVGRLVVLPNETPKVYIVQSDKSEIFQNPLFTGIAIGDNVLSYSEAGKVIIYRGSEDKVVNIVNTGQ